MDEIQNIVRIKIHEGKLDESKKLAAEFMELARTKDSGTLQYDLFFNDDYSECNRLAFKEGLCPCRKACGATFEDLSP